MTSPRPDDDRDMNRNGAGAPSGGRQDRAKSPYTGVFSLNRGSYVERRKAKIAEDVQRARRGDHLIPTWALAVVVLLVVVGLVILAATS